MNATGGPAEWGVFSFSRRRCCHEISKHRTQETALEARDLIRKRVDAWALLVHYEPTTGRWRPVTRVEVTR